jgi:hypothetical protein
MQASANPSMKKFSLSILSGAALVALLAISFVGCKPSDEQRMFHGKVQDQGLEPVADAEVTAKISTPNSSGDRPALLLKSDANGLFKFKLLPGEKIELTARKQGYALADTNTTIEAGSSPDTQFTSNQLAVLKMWKLQGAEPLASFNGTSQFLNAGIPVYFDFVTKTFSKESGDIKITVNRPDGIIAPADQPDWSVQLESTAEGGFAEVTPDIWKTTSWAPTTGYGLTHNLMVSKGTSRGWSTNAHGYYFAQTRHGGIYSKMLLNVRINADPKLPYLISIAGVANTNGSCNWEANIGAPIPQ